MLKVPENVVTTRGGTVEIGKLELSYFSTRVAKSAKNQKPIFGTIYRCEDPTSKKGKKKVYVVGSLEEFPSAAVLKVFQPDTYSVDGRGKAAGAQGGKVLLADHVKEICEFAVSRDRYIAWLGRGAGASGST